MTGRVSGCGFDSFTSMAPIQSTSGMDLILKHAFVWGLMC